MEYIYNPRGVCSRQFVFDIEEGIVKNVKIMGGCHGNLQGIASLLKGMNIDDVITRLQGIRCGMKPTSCPDQIAKGLESYKNQL
ncbi:MAG: TIGR03905 family TSCPD domain-containing protein [Oscillospiraceae bacterium]|nr:TIGR03905 family TSCPD domain-containing protein [Oscillospiraceae bacterium]